MRAAHYLITVTLSINKQEIRGIERKRGKVAVMSTKDATANVAAAAAALPKTWSPIPRWRQRERETPCHRRQVSSSVCAVQRERRQRQKRGQGEQCVCRRAGLWHSSQRREFSPEYYSCSESPPVLFTEHWTHWPEHTQNAGTSTHTHTHTRRLPIHVMGQSN